MQTTLQPVAQVGVLFFTPDLKKAVLTDGTWVPVTDWLDDEGDDTEHFDEVEMVVGGTEFTGYFLVEPALLPYPTFH